MGQKHADIGIAAARGPAGILQTELTGETLDYIRRCVSITPNRGGVCGRIKGCRVGVGDRIASAADCRFW